MTARKKAGVSWMQVLPFGWSIGLAIIGGFVAGVTFYVTTTSTLNHHEEAIKALLSQGKEEGQARAKIRDDFLKAIGEQTNLFKDLTADVKVQATKYENLVTSVNKLGDKIENSTIKSGRR